MADADSPSTYVFTKEAVLRSIARLETQSIHEHFAAYLAILRAQQENQGLAIRLGDISEFHDRYLRVVGAPDRAPYVRPFKSRGQGLETFNVNVAGSYAPSSLRSKGRLIEVIEVKGERKNATYALREDHAALALDRLLMGRKVPVAALTAFLYRDYGFLLDTSDVRRIVQIFRREFGLSGDVEEQRRAFETLFADDIASFKVSDLELLKTKASQNG